MAFFGKHFWVGALIGAVFAIGSCSAKAGVSVIDDNFKPGVYLTSTTQKQGELSFNLQAIVNRQTGNAVYALFMTTQYTDSAWRKWSKASTANAEALEVRLLNAEVVSCYGSRVNCRYYERLFALLPRELVDAVAAGQPVQVKFFAPEYSQVYTLEPAIVAELVDAVKAQRAMLGMR